MLPAIVYNLLKGTFVISTSRITIMISSGDKKRIGKKKNWGNLLSINRPIDRKKNRCGTYNFDFVSMMCGKAVYLSSCFVY